MEPWSYIAVPNAFSESSYKVKDIIAALGGPVTKEPILHYQPRSDEEKRELEKINDGVFLLDQELLPILRTLAVTKGEQLLDMFSNTSSTSMGLLQLLARVDFSITINEGTPDKYQKLKKCVFDTVSKEVEAQIRLTGWDAVKFGTAETQMYDKVILDVPCSNEKKVFNDEKQMKKWTDKVRLYKMAYKNYTVGSF